MAAVYLVMAMAAGGDYNGDGIITPDEGGIRWTQGIGFLVVGVAIIVVAGIRIATDRNDKGETETGEDNQARP